MLYRIQKKESRILFSSPNTCVQRFDRVLSAFIFIILAPDYSLKPPPFLWERRNNAAGVDCKIWGLSYKSWGAGFTQANGPMKALRTGCDTRGWHDGCACCVRGGDAEVDAGAEWE